MYQCIFTFNRIYEFSKFYSSLNFALLCTSAKVNTVALETYSTFDAEHVAVMLPGLYVTCDVSEEVEIVCNLARTEDVCYLMMTDDFL